MPLTAQDIDELRAAGASLEIVTIVTRITDRHASSHDASRLPSRLKSKEAERSKRYRDKKRDDRHGRVTVASKSAVGSNNIITLRDSNNLPSTAKQQKNVTRGCRLSEAWQPNEGARAFGESIGIIGTDYDRHLEEFRDYWKARAGAGGVKLDWDATWRNRLRKISEYRKEKGNGYQQTNGSKPQLTQEQRDLIAKHRPNAVRGGH